MRSTIPLIVFLGLVFFLSVGLRLNLRRDPHEVPSPLINKPAPPFVLAQLQDPRKTLSPQELRGKVWLLNVFASWCVSCREEHPVLVDLARTKAVPIYGLNWKDKREDALSWLDGLGDPYMAIAADTDGRVAIDYGVYGAPETYLIDKNGVIRYKQIGPITPDVLNRTILPLVRELNR